MAEEHDWSVMLNTQFQSLNKCTALGLTDGVAFCNRYSISAVCFLNLNFKGWNNQKEVERLQPGDLFILVNDGKCFFLQILKEENTEAAAEAKR